VTKPTTFLVAGVMALAVLMVAGSPAVAKELTPGFGSGLSFESEDKKTSVKVGGRIHFDTAVVEGDDEAGGQSDGTRFRRVRFAMSGKAHGMVEWKAQLEFAGGGASFRDIYLGLTETPILGLGLRVGQFHQPMGLEVMTSSNYMTFIERAGAGELVPNRRSGFMLHRSLPQADGTVAISAFQDSGSQGQAQGDGVWNTAGRVTVARWRDPHAGQLLHLGVSAALRKNQDRMLEVTLGPESSLAPDFANDVTTPAKA